ncbi:response regulator transcription factor [Paenibacillus sp. LHD-117]|uniref:response regulator transcription factor n=1 Tax=Paenibacillus sp. LHD-117 TaxID=3071412 RepID=UPI0027DF80A0|nr:response regulator transcription factor [Paenibacillus sp. LHD-117]MDQ6418852.1 response regulator transcription factor [Paenibacillus sp. LHD-117]
MYKVMIVDDEPLILKGMYSIMDWEGHGLRIASQASSGEQALEQFLDHPVDVVMTDIRMPGMDGLKLIETIRSIDPSVKFIVLSGYDDFQYVKEGMRFGIENYLLKPVDVNELSATAATAVRKLELEGQRRIRSIEEKQILRTNVLNRWMSRSIPMAELKQRAEMADIPLHHRAYAVVTGSLLRSDQAGDSFPPDVRNELVSEVCELVRTDASELLSTYTTLDFVDFDGDIVILFSDHGGGLNREVLHRELESLYESVREQWRIDMLFSIGATVGSYLEVPESYRQAKEIQIQRMINSDRFIVDGEHAGTRVSSVEFLQELQTLTSLLAKKDRKELQLWIDDSFDGLKEHMRASLADAQDGALEIMLQVAKQTGRSNFMESFAQLFRLRSVDQIKQYIQQFAGESLDAVSVAEESRSPVISKVVQDIHTRYESELSLKTLGQIYNVHPVYLGQLFKKEIGVGFTDYVNGYRIQIARELLLQTDLKGSEIAARVGCLDPNYFYKLFTKFTGVSPTEFRSVRKGVPRG